MVSPRPFGTDRGLLGSPDTCISGCPVSSVSRGGSDVERGDRNGMGTGNLRLGLFSRESVCGSPRGEVGVIGNETVSLVVVGGA
jgi:hypothetical protein